MLHDRLDIGKSGEEAAVSFLKENGYRILDTNYKTRLGELDIVARDGGTVCFIEVKTRRSLEKGNPLESITAAKQRKLSALAVSYLKKKGLLKASARFDVVSVLQLDDRTDITLIKNAFELDGKYIY